MEPRKGLDDKDLANPRRAKPATVGMTMMLVMGALVMGASLAINVFTGFFSTLMFVIGVALIGIAIVVLVINAFKADAEN